MFSRAAGERHFRSFTRGVKTWVLPLWKRRPMAVVMKDWPRLISFLLNLCLLGEKETRVSFDMVSRSFVNILFPQWHIQLLQVPCRLVFFPPSYPLAAIFSRLNFPSQPWKLVPRSFDWQVASQKARYFCGFYFAAPISSYSLKSNIHYKGYEL